MIFIRVGCLDENFVLGPSRGFGNESCSTRDGVRLTCKDAGPGERDTTTPSGTLRQENGIHFEVYFSVWKHTNKLSSVHFERKFLQMDILK